MRFRLGLCLGFGAGYYLGSMAGRERYEQINRTLRKVKRSEVYETATDMVQEVVDTGVAKARDAVESARGNDFAPVDLVNEPDLPADPFLRPGPPLP